MSKVPVEKSIKALAEKIGVPAFVSVCVDLMSGADRNSYVEELRYLTRHAWNPGDNVFNPESWGDHWLRTWGARGLLHVWDDSATDAIVAGLAHEHWRLAEMCLKVAARHEVAETGDGAALLVSHSLPRVRVQALRALAIVGDTQHVEVVRRALSDADSAVCRQAEITFERLRQRLL